MSRQCNRLAARARSQCRHDWRCRVVQEMHRAVGVQKVRSAGMQAPIVEHVARVVHRAGAEWIRSRRAKSVVAAPHVIFFENAQEHVAGARRALPGAGVPVAEAQIGARRPFAGQERVADAVGDLDHAHLRIAEEDAVARAGVFAGHAEIAREGDRIAELPIEEGLARSGFERADIGGNHDRKAGVVRIGKRIARVLVVLLRDRPERLLIDVWQNQGQLQLRCSSRNDFQQELLAPAAAAPFHYGALFVIGMLLQQR